MRDGFAFFEREGLVQGLAQKIYEVSALTFLLEGPGANSVMQASGVVTVWPEPFEQNIPRIVVR
ncbi:hypothetical protein AWB65_04807 [Caballeronia humi]|uniref:Uncharacterized protein n=1 Tax=Caballeronia humi TaxID=326474 RepID=A0A158IHJ2_9BURK|nr:hypothetical protein AWB65_04807 [Caballeronia humi]